MRMIGLILLCVVGFSIKVSCDPGLAPSLAAISNYKMAAQSLHISDQAQALFSKNGFVQIPTTYTTFSSAYTFLQKRGIPLFVTSDSMLFLYRLYFSDTLKRLEETIFYPQMVALSQALMDESVSWYKSTTGDVKEAARRNALFFGVGLSLLTGTVSFPAELGDEGRWELDQITQAKGFPSDYNNVEENSLFKYPEDYSQYIVRGHYTQSKSLGRYFKAMMWYGRMGFLLHGDTPHGSISPPATALVSPQTAKLQTMQAALISLWVYQLGADSGQSLLKMWGTIYRITSYYVGKSDDLTLYDYHDAWIKLFGTEPVQPQSFARSGGIERLQNVLFELPNPHIFSGTGHAGFRDTPSPNASEKLLRVTKGLRFMGQRSVPDSEVFSQLVVPNVSTYLGSTPKPFTWISTQSNGVKGFPRSLEFFFILGSAQAKEILESEGDTLYLNYSKQIGLVSKEFSNKKPDFWQSTLYTNWLFVLKSLLSPITSPSYPAFMRTKAWTAKSLYTALASYATLKHDTLLYTKQSYTPMMTTSITPTLDPPIIPGYVEPVVELYSRLSSSVKMLRDLIQDEGILSAEAKLGLDRLETLCTQLFVIAQKELNKSPLSEADLTLIRQFPDIYDQLTAHINKRGQETILVTDIHTDPNTRQTVTIATGYADMILIPIFSAENGWNLAAGPALSFYEFKQPMKNRLTDESWGAILSAFQAPARPAWTQIFMSK